jgi:predicted phage tail protein
LSENTFSWIDSKASSGGADIVAYYLQIASTDQRPAIFDDPILIFSGLVTGLSKTFLGINNKSYYARVRAIDSHGNSSDYSPVSERLTLDSEGPSTPEFFLMNQELEYLKIEWPKSHDNVSSADTISYHGCIGTDYASIADCEMKLSKGEKTYELAQNFILVPMADYKDRPFYLRIVAMDEAGNKSLSRITPLFYRMLGIPTVTD